MRLLFDLRFCASQRRSCLRTVAAREKLDPLLPRRGDHSALMGDGRGREGARAGEPRASMGGESELARGRRTRGLTGAGDAASAGDALSTSEDDFQIVVDEPEEEAPPRGPSSS